MPRVLVIDDFAGVRRLVRGVLGAAGYDTEVASNREEALEVMRADPVDVVVCDVHLPGECGLDLIQEVATAFPGVAIVAMSGVNLDGPSDVLASASRLGANAILRKPFRGPEVVNAVRNSLNGREVR